MEPFILNRIDERRTRSVGRILLYALAFFLVTRFATGMLAGIAMAIYKFAWGIDAMAGLQFLGTPDQMGGYGWWALPQLLLFAPLFEETTFRLGLSFRRVHVALGLGVLTLFVVQSCLMLAGASHTWLWASLPGAAVGTALWLFTTDAFWAAEKGRWQRPAMWCSAILFGLAHLFAMPGLTWVLLPMALIMVLMLALSGCVLVYLRVNLGFWWGVGAHALINLPGAIMLLRQLLG